MEWMVIFFSFLFFFFCFSCCLGCIFFPMVVKKKYFFLPTKRYCRSIDRKYRNGSSDQLQYLQIFSSLIWASSM
ncbi:hypothetical protein DAI22_05g146301 [Oryza sativa Japonica Group]|nr:hypothetical protein DAI22_05g146301 [Oryza sativa Japonica Group]